MQMSRKKHSNAEIGYLDNINYIYYDKLSNIFMKAISKISYKIRIKVIDLATLRETSKRILINF